MKTPLSTAADLGPGHIVLDGGVGVPAPAKRHSSSLPLYGPCLLWPRSPISTTAELLLNILSGAFFRGHNTGIVDRILDKHVCAICGTSKDNRYFYIRYLWVYRLLESGFGFTVNLDSDSLGKSNDFRSVDELGCTSDSDSL